MEPNTELDEEDLDHIDLLAEHESILFINLLQRSSPDYDEDERSREERNSIQEYLDNLDKISKPKLSSSNLTA